MLAVIAIVMMSALTALVSLGGTAIADDPTIVTFTSTPIGGNWTVPANVYHVEVLVVGGGGGGGEGYSYVGGGGGGGYHLD